MARWRSLGWAGGATGGTGAAAGPSPPGGAGRVAGGGAGRGAGAGATGRGGVAIGTGASPPGRGIFPSSGMAPLVARRSDVLHSREAENQLDGPHRMSIAETRAGADRPPPPPPPPSPPPLPTDRPRPRRARAPGLRAVSALMLREMATTYGRSPGGYVWAILEPVLSIAILVLIFSVGLRLRTPGLGLSFGMFYATGVIAMFMFQDISVKLAQAINFSIRLLAYPRVTYVDAILGRLAMSALTQLMVAYIVLGGALLIFEEPVVLHYPSIALSLGLGIALGTGVGVLNCFLTTMFPLWQRVYGIATRPLILISGVIFLYDDIPDPWQGYLWWNPVVHVVGLMRRGFYPGYDAAYASVPFVLTVALVCGALGMVFLHRYHRELLEL